MDGWLHEHSKFIKSIKLWGGGKNIFCEEKLFNIPNNILKNINF